MILAAKESSSFLDVFVRHWACVTCRPDVEELDVVEDDHGDIYLTPATEDSSELGSNATVEALPLPRIYFPEEEVYSLRLRHKKSNPTTASTLGLIERPPIACGVVQRIHLLGIFPTCRWLADDPTMPPDVKELFGGTPFFPLGEYRVADVEIIDGAKTVHPLSVIVNRGVEGLETGYWGAAFSRQSPHECWARFETTGKHETTVKEEPATTGRTAFQEYDESVVEFCDEYFGKGTIPGTCSTQLERVLGLTAETLLELEWSACLPTEFLQIRDTSCRLDRKRRARITKQRASRSLKVDDLDLDATNLDKSETRQKE